MHGMVVLRWHVRWRNWELHNLGVHVDCGQCYGAGRRPIVVVGVGSVVGGGNPSIVWRCLALYFELCKYAIGEKR